MIGYITIGTNDLAHATSFYDAVLAEVGAKRLYSTDRLAAWGAGKDQPTLMVTLPFDENEATVGNGVMIALSVKDQHMVDAVYAKAIKLGAKDEGQPGPRGSSGFYAGYFRDPDGNKLNAFCRS